MHETFLHNFLWATAFRAMRKGQQQRVCALKVSETASRLRQTAIDQAISTHERYLDLLGNYDLVNCFNVACRILEKRTQPLHNGYQYLEMQS